MTSAYDFDDAREFVETYVAFSVSHLNGADPDLQTLSDFERKELIPTKTKGKEHTAKTRASNYLPDPDAELDEDDVMDSYISRTPKVWQCANVHYHVEFRFKYSSVIQNGRPSTMYRRTSAGTECFNNLSILGGP